MKKMIVASFAFLFLFAVVAGCPTNPGGSSSTGSGTSGNVDFGTTESSVVSTDQSDEVFNPTEP